MTPDQDTIARECARVGALVGLVVALGVFVAHAHPDVTGSALVIGGSVGAVAATASIARYIDAPEVDEA